MAASANSEACSICLQEECVEPRELPCGHQFCLECLKDNNVLNQTDVTCSVCNATVPYPEGGLSSLPFPAFSASGSTSAVQGGSVDVPCCSYCKHVGSKKQASMFCPDCQECFCEEDYQSHNYYMKEHLSCITIEVYLRRKDRYNVIPCEQHGLSLDTFCSKCRVWACAKCALFQTVQACTQGKHVFESSSATVHRISAKLSTAMKVVDDKQGEITVVQKQMFSMLDELKAAYKENIDLLDRVQNDQFENLSGKYTDLKSKVKSCLDNVDSAALEYDRSVLEAMSTDLRAVSSEVGMKLRKLSSSELIEHEESLYTRLVSAGKTNVELPSLSSPTLSVQSVDTQPAVILKETPIKWPTYQYVSMGKGPKRNQVIEGINYQRQLSTKNVEFIMSHGQGFVVYNSKHAFKRLNQVMSVEIWNRKCELKWYFNVDDGYPKVCCWEGRIYMFPHPNNSKYSVRVCSLKGDYLKTIFIGQSDNTLLKSVEIMNGEMLLVTNKSIDRYNLRGAQTGHINFNTASHLCTVDSQHIIIVDSNSKDVHKIDTKLSEIVWSFSFTGGMGQPCIDESGRVWIPQVCGAKLYVLSFDGQLLYELTRNEHHGSHICVLGDVLLVGTRDGLQQYKIEQ